MRRTQQRPWGRHHTHSLSQFGSSDVSIYTLLKDAGEKYATHTAVTFQGEKTTYGELKSRNRSCLTKWLDAYR